MDMQKNPRKDIVLPVGKHYLLPNILEDGVSKTSPVFPKSYHLKICGEPYLVRDMESDYKKEVSSSKSCSGLD